MSFITVILIPTLLNDLDPKARLPLRGLSASLGHTTWRKLSMASDFIGALFQGLCLFECSPQTAKCLAGSHSKILTRVVAHTLLVNEEIALRCTLGCETSSPCAWQQERSCASAALGGIVVRVELIHDFRHVLTQLGDALVHVVLRRLAQLPLLDFLTDWLHLYKN